MKAIRAAMWRRRSVAVANQHHWFVLGLTLLVAAPLGVLQPKLVAAARAGESEEEPRPQRSMPPEEHQAAPILSERRVAAFGPRSVAHRVSDTLPRSRSCSAAKTSVPAAGADLRNNLGAPLRL